MRMRLQAVVRAWALAGGVLLLVVVAVTMVNVGAFTLDMLARPFGLRIRGLPGYEDFVRLAAGSGVLMLFPYCQLRHGHITVDFFTEGLAASRRRRLDVLWLCCMFALALFLCAWMSVGAWETYNDNALSRVLGWPEWPFYVPGVVSLLLWAATAAINIADMTHNGGGDAGA